MPCILDLHKIKICQPSEVTHCYRYRQWIKVPRINKLSPQPPSWASNEIPRDVGISIMKKREIVVLNAVKVV